MNRSAKIIEHSRRDFRIVIKSDGTEIARRPDRERAVSYVRGWNQIDRITERRHGKQ